MDYGAVGDGTTDDYAAIDAAIDAVPKGQVYNDPRIPEGGIVYFPGGKYKINTTLDLSSGETVDGHRQGLHLKGDGMLTTILYSDTLTTMIQANTAVDSLSISDMSIICFANFTGLGTLESVLSFISCLKVRLNRVKIYVRYPGARNTDCILLYLENCYYSQIFSCETVSFIVPTAEKHNISFAANTNTFGSTHIRSKNNNALYIKDHYWGNPYRGMHLINDDGISIHGGAIESYVQGFLFESSSGNILRDVRFETHPESYMQYDGDGTQYSVMFDEHSSNNLIDTAGYLLQSNMADLGFKDYNGNNIIKNHNLPKKHAPINLIKNGDFRNQYYLKGSTKIIPGWIDNSSAAMANETSDLPPEPGITRALKVTTNINTAGFYTTLTLDPARFFSLAFKFWMKRLSGDHTLRFMLYDPGSTSYLVINAPENIGSTLTRRESGLPISSVSWSGGVLTINTATQNHFVKVNQRIALAGFTVSGTSLTNTYTVSSVIDKDTFTLAVAANPGTISVVGTYGRIGIEDVADFDSWSKYTGFIRLRVPVTAVDDTGSNVMLTTSKNHLIPNSVSANVKLYGFSNPNYNGTFAIISTTATTITLSKPSGAMPVDTGKNTGNGNAFYGWAGFVGTIRMLFGAEYISAAVSAEHLVTGIVVTNGSLDELQNSYPSAIDTLVGSVTYDPPSIPSLAAGSTSVTTVTVAGAVAGDAVRVGFSNFDAGLQWTGQVSSADTVTVTVLNTTAGSINLSSGTLTVFVDHVY
jgi:hypothetical protein